MMHLIINLVFLTTFQFINLSNFKLDVIALWANNRRKWITVILINLCGNLLYYMIYLCLLSLCPCLYLFFFVFLFCHSPSPTTNTMILLYTINKHFTIFIPWKLNHFSYCCDLSLFYCPTTTQIFSLISRDSTLSLSLSIYIYI